MKPQFILGNKFLQFGLLFHKKPTTTNKIRLMSAVVLFSMIVSMFFGLGNLQSVPEAHALNNGLALTPPMGWNSWNKFNCNVTDALVRQMADAMVSSGMAAAGYKYINIDDCWQGTGRTNGHVNLDPDFPNMKALGDYIHSKGLKFGIYSDHGDLTCQGRVGSYGYETTDANDYAAWGVDLLKYDNCNIHPGSNQQQDYERMRNALAASGRAIVYSICAWVFQSWMPATGNLWRTTGDISDTWDSMWSLPNANNASAAVAGPGAWNDPDMLEVGNGGMTDTEYRTHFGWWAIMAAPLIAGNDLRSVSQATKDILMAPEIIAVDQDPAGRQGTRVWDGGNGQNIWSKVQQGTNRRAVFVLNGSTATTNITVNWSQIGLPAGNATVRDLWSRTDLGTFSNSFAVNSIPAHGSRMLLIETVGSGPAGYTYCAQENGTCSFSGTSSVAYGANGSFFYRTATSGIACNNATFGDPLSGATKSCYYQPIGVVFYQNADYSGATSGGVVQGDYASLPGNVPNDWMSSLKVPAGWAVDTYSDGNFAGTVCTFTANTNFVGAACNDVMSSFKVRSTTGPTATPTRTPTRTNTPVGPTPTRTRTPTPPPATGVIFYQDANYGGVASGLKAKGDYAVLPGDVPNDWMSSLRVPAGWIVDAYADGGFAGAVCTYTADTSWVGSACNDVMSSFRIR